MRTLCLMLLPQPANAVSVANPRHVQTRRINNLRPSEPIECKQAANLAPVDPAIFLMRPRDMHIKRLHRGAHAADGFAGPERLTQNREPAIFQFAHHTKSIALVGGLISVQTPFGEVALQLRVGGQNGLAGAQAEGFSFEPLDQFADLLVARLRHDDAAARRFSKSDFAIAAKITDPVEVAEKIENKRLLCDEGWEDAGPDCDGVLASHGFAALGFDQLHADGLDARSEVQRFHVEGIGGKIQLAHSSSSAWGNFALNSGDFLRTSSQSKNASGVSSQMRNQFDISSFSARFCGSTLRLRAIISARRLPRRATSSTRPAAAFSPWV